MGMSSLFVACVFFLCTYAHIEGHFDEDRAEGMSTLSHTSFRSSGTCGFPITSRQMSIAMRYTPFVYSKLRSLNKKLHNIQEKRPTTPCCDSFAIDGVGNNAYNPQWGSTGSFLKRLAPARKEIEHLPSPRLVSNTLCRGETVKSARKMTDFVWLWGQFLDHDISLTPESEPKEAMDVSTDAGGPDEPFPGRTIPFSRAVFTPGTQKGDRRYRNVVTTFIDASNVYGSHAETLMRLRRLDGTGKMLTSTSAKGEVLLPLSEPDFFMILPKGVDRRRFFKAGDGRANEQIALTAMHTLFVREHNRQCDEFMKQHPAEVGNEELIFQHARSKVVAMMQAITEKEFLPALLGDFECPAYDANVDPTAALEFSSAGYRFGHSMVSPSLRTGRRSPATLKLREAFFNPEYVREHGVDGLLIGAQNQMMNEVDEHIEPELLDFLFGGPDDEKLMDLATFNMQRGRDMSLPSYTQMREVAGLSPINSFDDMDVSDQVRERLQSVYESVHDIDLWIGCLCERHVSGASVGPLLETVLRKQFTSICSGDSRWYKHSHSYDALVDISETTLGDVLNRNCGDRTAFRGDVFHLP